MTDNAPEVDIPAEKKKVSFWDRIPFHPFFLTAYPVLFLVVHNGVRFRDGAPLILSVCLAILALLFFLLSFPLRNPRQIGALLALWVILFFWTVPLCSFAKTNAPFRVGNSTVYYLLLLYPIGTIGILRSRGSFYFTTRLLNSISAVLVAFVVVGLIANSWERPPVAVVGNLPQTENSTQITNEGVKETLPDIYLIVCDAYAGDTALKTLYHFDNSSFFDELHSRNFQTIRLANSNYGETQFSIPSLLNMDYLNSIVPESDRKNVAGFHLKRLVFQYVFDNRVVEYLRARGYRFVHFLNHFQETGVKIKTPPDFMVSTTNNGDFYSLFYDTTLLRLYGEGGFHLAGKRRETLTSFELLREMPGKYTEKPVFVYVHFFVPQPPFAFQSDGSPQRYHVESRCTPGEMNEMYVEQIRFTNRSVLEAIDAIVAKSKTDPLIVLLSDHGSRFSGSENSTEATALRTFNNFITIRLPGEKRLDSLERMANVNVFRTVLNAAFGERFPMLENKYYLDFDTDKTTEIAPVFERLEKEVLGPLQDK